MARLTILMPVYKEIHPRTRESLSALFQGLGLAQAELGVELVDELATEHVFGNSCVTQARNAVATQAIQRGAIDPEGFAMWIDSDMVFSPATVAAHLAALDELHKAHGIEAMAGRCVQRNVMALAAVHDKNRVTINDDKHGEVWPVFAGMASLLIRGSEFIRQALAAPREMNYDNPEQVDKYVVCCPCVEEVEGRNYFFSEDFDYARKLRGGVWLAPTTVPSYGHVTEQVVYANLKSEFRNVGRPAPPPLLPLERLG